MMSSMRCCSVSVPQPQEPRRDRMEARHVCKDARRTKCSGAVMENQVSESFSSRKKAKEIGRMVLRFSQSPMAFNQGKEADGQSPGHRNITGRARWGGGHLIPGRARYHSTSRSSRTSTVPFCTAQARAHLQKPGHRDGPFAPHRGTCHLAQSQIPAWVVVRQRGRKPRDGVYAQLSHLGRQTCSAQGAHCWLNFGPDPPLLV